MDRKVLVFDLETIADLTPVNCDAIAALARGRELTAEAYGALCPPLARVICLCWHDLATETLGALFDVSLCSEVPAQTMQVEASGDLRACELHPCASEAAVLEAFGRLIERHLSEPEAQLVSFNGRGFDLPVLVHRSIKHGVTAGRDLLVRAMAENRYRPERHVDVMDLVTFCGATPRFPLAAYAVAYGWPSPKAEMHGSEVGSAVRAGRLLDVVRYCTGDVLATSHVYTNFTAHPGSTADAPAA